METTCNFHSESCHTSSLTCLVTINSYKLLRHEHYQLSLLHCQWLLQPFIYNYFHHNSGGGKEWTLMVFSAQNTIKSLRSPCRNRTIVMLLSDYWWLLSQCKYLISWRHLHNIYQDINGILMNPRSLYFPLSLRFLIYYPSFNSINFLLANPNQIRTVTGN